MTPQHRIPLTVVQVNTVKLAHQLNIYSKGCFCFLPAEDLDGRENKCVFYLFVEHSGIVVSAWGEKVRIWEEDSTRWIWTDYLAAFDKKMNKKKNRPTLPQNHDLDSMSSGVIIYQYDLVIWF